MNAHQYLIALDDRLVDVPDTEDVERTVFVVDNRPHRLPGEPGHMSLPREPDPTPVLSAPKFVVTFTFELRMAAEAAILDRKRLLSRKAPQSSAESEQPEKQRDC